MRTWRSRHESPHSHGAKPHAGTQRPPKSGQARDGVVTTARSAAYAKRIRAGWGRHGSALLVILAVCTLLAALWRLPTALAQLVWWAEAPHPTDLRARYGEVAIWFGGIAVDPRAGQVNYPPASYPMLWPLLGWLSLPHVRWLWAATAMAALALLARQMMKASGATTRAQRLTMLLLPFSGYATSAALSVGQLGNHVLPMVVGGTILLSHGRGRWRRDAAGAAMFLFGLVKPTLSAPFFWVVCFATGRLRPVILVTTGYLGLTLFAASFQTEGLASVLTGWLGATPNLLRGHANLHKWLALGGLASWTLPATALALGVSGWWIHRYRQADFWILMGVAALVTRLAFHHRIYDDLLLLVPMVTLFRLARTEPVAGSRDLIAGLLFGLLWATLHLPVRVFSYPPPLPGLVEAGQAAAWMAALIFLLAAARHQARRSAPYLPNQ